MCLIAIDRLTNCKFDIPLWTEEPANPISNLFFSSRWMQQLTHEGRMFTHKNYNMKNVQYDCKFKRGYSDVRGTLQEALTVEKYQSEGGVRPLEPSI